MEDKKYIISDHCKQRYAERIMDKDNKADVNQFIAAHKDKIEADIHKMISYGQLIYTGRQYKDNKKNVVDVYIKDTWVVLIDNASNVVITLYKIDLGLDDEFNKTYVAKMLDTITEAQEHLKKVEEEKQAETENYRNIIAESENQIKEYKSMIHNLEQLCSGYKTIIDNNHVEVTQAKRQVAERINTLIGRKEF